MDQFIMSQSQPATSSKRQEKQTLKQQKNVKPIIEIKIGKKISTSAPSNAKAVHTVPDNIKQAITKTEWEAYEQSRQAFFQCLKKHEWGDEYPQLERVKNRIDKESRRQA